LIDASRTHGTLADSAEVATFMDKMGGGRTITPLPGDLVAASAPTAASAGGGVRDDHTMTLPSISIGGAGLLAESVVRRPVGRGQSLKRAGLGVLALAVSAGGLAVLATRPMPRHARAIAVDHSPAPAGLPRAVPSANEATMPAAILTPAALVSASATTTETVGAAADPASPSAAAPAPHTLGSHRRHNVNHHGREPALHAHATIVAHSAHAGVARAPAPPPLAGNPYADERP
jgi:hypothetical protein